MGFLCPRMQQIHSTTLEYFCSNTSVSPQVLCCSCCRWRVGGGGNRGRGGEVCGFWLRVVACHVSSFSRSRCYFVVFPFILQSKEYRRNVPGNPTRKCVEKEVCKKKRASEKAHIQEKRRFKGVNEEGEWWVHPSKAAINSTYQLPNQSANWDERGTGDSDKPWHQCRR